MNLKKQLAVILKCKDSSFKVQHVDVQRQIGSPAADCGVFSIAFAICIYNKLDPHTVGFDQSKMHSHYVACIERERFTHLKTKAAEI